MNNSGGLRLGRIRVIIFAAVSLLHVLLIFFVAFKMETVVREAEPVAWVMKLVDVQEELPPPKRPVDLPQTTTTESIAETMIPTEEPPPPVVIPQSNTVPEQIEYLPQHKISMLPALPEDQIIRATVYPPIAQRSNIEGRVFLELFIDRQGNVRDVRILKEDPPDRGFGAAAVNAFKGIRGKPAEANGEPVAVRYRYAFNFKLN